MRNARSLIRLLPVRFVRQGKLRNRVRKRGREQKPNSLLFFWLRFLPSYYFGGELGFFAAKRPTSYFRTGDGLENRIAPLAVGVKTCCCPALFCFAGPLESLHTPAKVLSPTKGRGNSGSQSGPSVTYYGEEGRKVGRSHLHNLGGFEMPTKASWSRRGP